MTPTTKCSASRAYVHSADHGEERSLVNSLMEELSSFTGQSWEQEDDITLMTLQRSAAHR